MENNQTFYLILKIIVQLIKIDKNTDVRTIEFV